MLRERESLLSEKAQLRGEELSAAERHLDRLRLGRPGLETTSLHLDVLRDPRLIQLAHLLSCLSGPGDCEETVRRLG